MASVIHPFVVWGLCWNKSCCSDALKSTARFPLIFMFFTNFFLKLAQENDIIGVSNKPISERYIERLKTRPQAAKHKGWVFSCIFSHHSTIPSIYLSVSAKLSKFVVLNKNHRGTVWQKVQAVFFSVHTGGGDRGEFEAASPCLDAGFGHADLCGDLAV